MIKIRRTSVLTGRDEVVEVYRYPDYIHIHQDQGPMRHSSQNIFSMEDDFAQICRWFLYGDGQSICDYVCDMLDKQEQEVLNRLK